ncbi:DUF255 domain-containing protein [Tuwongella immobilis]|uniref:Spermatogenesis-associated protein 20-like TRX domain-containing protein n=1 Tax=Tuwongella immobilis TaxID=692036 RepID=A0A6C2YML2_9BACT|nr:DUF255 domain-containing protein [Tuwongella immobilis]VIP02676.1 thiol-disulfide interchange like protein : Uncharacterized protein OS=Planctomyces maris DSM 8797 GN=PM8797T_14179 PE=4 SV=1: Thioredox_DsbH [Tuwongella immobilis]VTS02117.1 thiol-disulfide interchange like protein : Uncharacterized protein OS=Planctomyces maris DSM 8797 GN=PM8797T_14179 PE=4 SV=1: Thioredox_DsbH [Tuwongella immobilis]
MKQAPNRYPQRLAGWSLILLFLLVAPVQSAEPIAWRTEYNAARQEANQKNRPLLIDIGTEACTYCKKLDLTTFQDPTVMTLLNQRFVPLKVDGNLEPNLTQALRITVYPTLIIASTDGKILAMIEGYMDAPRLTEHLNRAIANATPDFLARDFQEANKAINEGNYARAVALLKSITGDSKESPIKLKASDVLAGLEQQAAGQLARAKQMNDRGQSLEAMDVLTSMVQRFTGTQAANDAGLMLSSLAAQPELRDGLRVRRARELLALARDDYRSERFLNCLDHCDILSNTYRDLPEGKEGSHLATQVRDNPEMMAKVVESMNDRMGGMYLALAESHLKKGNHQEASKCLERLVAACPNSEAANKANVTLAQLRGKMTEAQTAGFQKP